MRLIDADELLKHFDDWNMDIYTSEVSAIINCQPTVEQKHGHWKRRNMDIVEHPLHCTNCGWSNYHIDRYVKSFKICPECGAKMDEVSE